MVQRIPDPNLDNAAGSPGLAAPVGDDDHVLGLSDAPMTLVLYGDYECPYTRAVLPVIRDVRERLGDELLYVYRHYPIRELHPHAQKAAEVAEAAGVQGKFWAMHDMLFSNQRQLEVPDLVRYARMLGLDAHRVQHELASHVHAARVEADVASGRVSGVGGTPALFVNGVQYNGIHETDVLEEALMTASGLA